MDEPELTSLDYCYITTTGRRSGNPHTIEIWFAVAGGRVYVLSGGRDRSDWVRNIEAHPTVGLRIGDRDWIARAYVVEDPAEDDLARRALYDKYRARSDEDLDDWRATALPIAIELPEAPTGPSIS